MDAADYAVRKSEENFHSTFTVTEIKDQDIVEVLDLITKAAYLDVNIDFVGIENLLVSDVLETQVLIDVPFEAHAKIHIEVVQSELLKQNINRYSIYLIGEEPYVEMVTDHIVEQVTYVDLHFSALHVGIMDSNVNNVDLANIDVAAVKMVYVHVLEDVVLVVEQAQNDFIQTKMVVFYTAYFHHAVVVLLAYLLGVKEIHLEDDLED